MKFRIYRTSNAYKPEKPPTEGCTKEYNRRGDWYYTKEINSIEEILELSNIKTEIVISNKDHFYNLPKIEIYDDYREQIN